ncbi:MAG: hypothetical protein WCK70_20080 [Chloroflexales bacterium]
MWQSLRRILGVALLGLTLALGIAQAQQQAQQPTPMQVADPGNGSGGT